MARGLVALATLAALLWAPLPVSAAVNGLSAAHVSPSAGDVTTVFVMRVRYDGGFPATGVTVTAAGTARPMLLEQGTLSSGTWVLATPLPAGTWPLTFAATASRGPSPTLSGPTISVAGLPAATPTASASTRATTPRSSESVDQPGDDAASVDEPDVAPAGSPEPAPASAEPASRSQASPDDAGEPTAPGGATAPSTSSTENGDPDDGATGNGSATDPTDRPGSGTTVAPGTSPMPEPPGGGAPPAAGGDDPAAGTRTASPVGPDALLGMVLVIGLIGVAAVALVGTLLLVAGRRRHDPEEPAAALAPGAAPHVTATDDLLARRTIQRARMRLADDPILSALGVDEQMQARRNRHSRRVSNDDRPDRDA